MNNSKRIADDLRALISEGGLVDDQLPTENSLMAKYRASRYAVRKATEELQKQGIIYKVQGGGTFVNKAYKKKTLSHAVGLVTAGDLTENGLLNTISTAFFKKGYTLFTVETHNSPQSEYESLRSFYDLNADAVLIEPSQSAVNTQSLKLLGEMQVNKIFTFFLFSSYPSVSAPLFSLTDADSEAAVTSEVIQMGHKRLLGIFQVDDMRSVLRMNGFIRAYQQHPEVALNSYMETYQSSESLRAVIERVRMHFIDVDKELRPTAIVVHDDRMALQVMSMLQRAGIRVPEDVSIVGFGDSIQSNTVTPTLATVSFDKPAFVSHLVQQTLLAISGEKPVSKQFPAYLIKRKSLSRYPYRVD